AARVAFNQPAIVAAVNAQTVVPIFMGWTTRGPPIAAGRHANQSGKKINHPADLLDRRRELAAPRSPSDWSIAPRYCHCPSLPPPLVTTWQGARRNRSRSH